MNKDVMIGFPVYAGNLQPETMKQVLNAQSDPDCCVGSVAVLQGDSLVTRARNKIVKEFLASKMEYLVFVDSDIIFNAKQLNKLRKHQKGIVGGVYLKKKLPYSPVANGFVRRCDDGLMVMREIGTGFMMVHRSVFEAMIDKFDLVYRPDSDEDEGNYYDFFKVGKFEGENVNSDGRYLSEDYYFCIMARELGYEIFYDPNILVGHAGHAVFPFPDNDLIISVVNLLEQWNPERPYPVEILQSLHNLLSDILKK
jgi:hypothetical protein